MRRRRVACVERIPFKLRYQSGRWLSFSRTAAQR